MRVNRILYYVAAVTTLFGLVMVMLFASEAIKLWFSPMTGTSSYLWFITMWVFLAGEVIISVCMLHKAQRTFAPNEWCEAAIGFRLIATLCTLVLLWTELMFLKSTEVLV